MRIAFNASFARKLLASTAVVSALTMGVAAYSGAAQAEEMMSASERATLEARLEQLRLAALASPNDMQLQFSRAMTAKQLGYTDEAIRTLAAMVEKQDGLARAELELAALYYQTGDFEKARPHFVAAQASPKASTELKERIALYLEAIDNRTRRSITTGTAVVGIGFQTNANSGPGEFDLNGAEGQIDEEDDFNLFASVGVKHNQKIGDGNRAVWESTGKFYGSLQFDVDQVNLAYVEATSGVKFGLANETPLSMNFKPYVKLGYMYLDDDTYFYAPSAGGIFNVAVGESGTFGAGYEYTRSSFENTDTRPRTEERDSDGHELTLTYATKITAQDFVTVSLSGMKTDAEAKYWSYEGVEAGVRYNHMFSDAIVPGTLPGSVSLGVKYTMNDYDAADPSIDPNNVREDDRLIVDAGAVLPLSDQLGISLAASYTTQDSNVSLYEYDNLRVLAGVAFGF